jgi:abortive infection bacteriophage resistance protein
MAEYTNQALEIEEQIERLEKNGLIIADREQAIRILSIVSYFRLANYWRPMEVDKVKHLFKPNSTFDNALSLYYFDKELRALIFAAIQSIEIALRTKIIHHFSLAHGPFWFMNDGLMKSTKQQEENLSSLSKELSRSKEDFIKEHFQKYTSPAMPPAWKTLEVASFGVLSKLYGNFKDKTAKKKIAREFGVPQHEYLESWMRSIAVLRNCCAHHARIWNRRFSMIPQIPQTMQSAWIENMDFDNTKLYPLLCCVVYWLNSIYADHSFTQKFKLLLKSYPNIDITAMGFPPSWENEPLWNN